jgi:hypothetical protein
MRNTLWYRFAGTGSEVTVDTAGSRFDTMLAVYVPTAAGLTEIACVDDPGPRVAQAAIALDTEVGTTYYVQVGGFLSGFQPSEYGVLRVALIA